MLLGGRLGDVGDVGLRGVGLGEEVEAREEVGRGDGEVVVLERPFGGVGGWCCGCLGERVSEGCQGRGGEESLE